METCYHGLIYIFLCQTFGSLKVRESAEHAIRWAESLGLKIPLDDLVLRLASLGARGAHEQNCERDLHRIIQKFGTIPQVPVTEISARFYDFRTDELEWRKLGVIMPDDLAKAFWSMGEDIFKYFFVGDSNLQHFWNSQAKAHWYQQHPGFHLNRSKLIPVAMYGDDVQAFRNTEGGNISVVAWCSEVTFLNSALSRYFLLGAYSEATSTEYTYSVTWLILQILLLFGM